MPEPPTIPKQRGAFFEITTPRCSSPFEGSTSSALQQLGSSRRRSRGTAPTSPRTGATPEQKPHRLPAPGRSPHLRRGQELPRSARSRPRPRHLLLEAWGLGPGRALRGGVSAAPSRSPAAGPAPLSGYVGAAPSRHPHFHTNNPRACAYVTGREACQGRL